VGNEFSSVEALWSQFENVMAKDEPEEAVAKSEERGESQEETDRVKTEESE
jgi:DASH complex subunit DAD1